MDLTLYDHIIVSLSGGKDSHAMLWWAYGEALCQGVQDRLIAIHADTGAEWKQTRDHCRYLCDNLTVRLTVATPFRPLPEHIEKRGMWPSAACRYCTSDCKRAAIDKVIRWMNPASEDRTILILTGERREESPKRSKLRPIEAHERLSTRKRKVISWRPMLDAKVERIWELIEESGLRRHPAYDFGNDRLSCAMCVLASENDIRNGARFHPELAETYLRMERDMKHTFRSGRSLADILRKESCE